MLWCFAVFGERYKKHGLAQSDEAVSFASFAQLSAAHSSINGHDKQAAKAAGKAEKVISGQLHGVMLLPCFFTV